MKSVALFIGCAALLSAQVPHMAVEIPHERVIEEEGRGEELTRISPSIKGTPAEMEQLRAHIVFQHVPADDPVLAANRLQEAFRKHDYKVRPPDTVVQELRNRYRTEADPRLRDGLKTGLKLAKYGDWNFQVKAKPDGGLESWHAIQGEAQTPAPPGVLQKQQYTVYLEDHTNLAGVDSGARIVSAASLVAHGKLKARMLQDAKAAAVFADFIYDQRTSKTFRRITPDGFDENSPKLPECGTNPIPTPACAVVLLSKAS